MNPITTTVTIDRFIDLAEVPEVNSDILRKAMAKIAADLDAQFYAAATGQVVEDTGPLLADAPLFGMF